LHGVLQAAKGAIQFFPERALELAFDRFAVQLLENELYKLEDFAARCHGAAMAGSNFPD
jgi:hypothetical protein